MHRQLLMTGIILGAIALPVTVNAHGCTKGAVVGGVAGHLAGHHAVAGAVVGCAIGHHDAKVKEKQVAQSRSEATRAPPATSH